MTGARGGRTATPSAWRSLLRQHRQHGQQPSGAGEPPGAAPPGGHRDGFDPEAYLDLNPDLRPAGITAGGARDHYERFGRSEGRQHRLDTASYAAILAARGDEVVVSLASHWSRYGRAMGIPALCGDDAVTELARIDEAAAAAHGCGGRRERRAPEDAAATLWQSPYRPAFPYEDPRACATFFGQLAAHRRCTGNEGEAAQFEALALYLGDPAAVEARYRAAVDAADWATAEAIADSHLLRSPWTPWLQSKLPDSADAVLDRHRGSRDALLRSLDEFPQWTHAAARLPELDDGCWTVLERYFDAAAAVGARGPVAARAASFARTVLAGVRVSGGARRRSPRVVMVADMGLRQCVRYRVDQKRRAFDELGIGLDVVPWHGTSRDDMESAVAFADVVLFYRTPCRPQTLGALGRALARGAATVFEVDDALYDPRYPPPLRDFHGAVGAGVHQRLLRDGALFEVMARQCRFGLASTDAIADDLAALVEGGRAGVLPNGLDDLHDLPPGPGIGGGAVRTVAYATASAAHKGDLALAAEGVAAFLRPSPGRSLLLVGPADLRQVLGADVHGQVVHEDGYLPPPDYLRALRRADVVLVPLRDNVVNRAKSSIRWLDATAAGVPCVASPVGAYAGLCAEGAAVPVGDGGWAAALDGLADPLARGEVVARAARLAQDRFSPRARAAALGALVEEWLSG